MLRHLLNSHPHICCHGEVMAGGLKSFTGLEDRPKLPLFVKLHQLRENDPVSFLRDYVLFPGEMDAVGFKIKYEELVQPAFAAILQCLLADSELKVIHLRRRNRMKRVISKVAATRIHGVYNVTDPGQRPAVKRFSLTPAECLQDFENVSQGETKFGGMFASHPMLEVVYEDLVSPENPVLPAIQQFLEVEPRELLSRTQKMNPDSISDVIENYSELSAYFASTPYAEYFRG